MRPAASWPTTTGSPSVFESGAQRDGGASELAGAGSLWADPGNGAAASGPEPAPGEDQPDQDQLPSEPAASAGPPPVGGAASEPFGTVPRPAADGGTEPFGTVPRPAADGGAEPFGTRRQSGVSLPANGESAGAELASAPLGAFSAYRWETGLTNGEVIVPPAESLAEENRLPIFEAVESDWFRHGRSALGWSSEAEQPEEGWVSPADEGWRAAEIVPAPSSAGVTAAGLPKRVPQANLVPGSAASSVAAGPDQVRGRHARPVRQLPARGQGSSRSS